MGKKVNEKCVQCASVDMRNLKDKPECYQIRKCARRRSYYRHHDADKKKQRERHIYIKYADDHCAMCNSTELLEVHHIRPQVLGAEHTRMNTMTLCHHCHKVITKYYNIVIGRPNTYLC